MQLRNARLCLDCDEVHEDQHCPVCASESFAFLTRWVPAGERRARQRPPEAAAANRETIDTYKELLTASQEPRLSTWQLVRGGAVSLAVLGAAGWLLRKNSAASPPPPADSGNGDGPGK
jgi:hypothetical protein